MFIDIHSHILPGLDDGASDIDASLSMLKIANSNKTQYIVASSHYIVDDLNNSKSLIIEECNKLNKIALENCLDIQVLPGCEIFIDPAVTDLLKEDKIITINNSSYILVELPMMSIPPFTSELLYSLQLNGYKVILAHPERNKEILSNPKILFDFVQRNIFAQMNSGSICGIFGREIAKKSMEMLKHNLIHFIASDAHTSGERSPNLSPSAEIIQKKFGKDMVDLLFIENGLKVINNKYIETETPKPL